MPVFPEIDWPLFSVAVRMQLGMVDRALLAQGREAKLADIARHVGVSRSALARAKGGQSVGAANYLVLCDRLELEPWRYVKHAERMFHGEHSTDTETGTGGGA